MERYECCETCRHMCSIEKWDYEHGNFDPIEGYACTGLAEHGTVAWMLGQEPQDGMCEMYEEDKVYTVRPENLAEGVSWEVIYRVTPTVYEGEEIGLQKDVSGMLVRCRDCKFKADDEWMLDAEPSYFEDHLLCTISGGVHGPNWFCADGRREVKHDEQTDRC